MKKIRDFVSQSFTVLLLAILIATPVLQGCASRGGKTYGEGEVRKAQSIYYGTILSVHEVMVENDPSVIGPVIGGATGGILGSLIGGGRGKTLAILGGVLAGAVAGGATEYAARRYKALELTIELDKKHGTIVVVQGIDDYFVKGDRVRLIESGDGTIRVGHI